MSAIEDIKAVAQAFLAATPGIGVTTLSWRVFADTKKLGAVLDDQADLHTRRHEKAMQWFADNWPEETAWPTLVERPSRSEAAA